MRLYQAAGIEMKIEGTEDSHALLVAAAQSFLLAGGVLTLSDWRDLDADERLAFVEARVDLLADEADSAALEAAVEGAVP